ncbi:hypothetical protein [Polaribacter porphyrae]|uniref:Uncharacterized protein n=1 Tax=Polaribacter porphyrae TaxID=1137780 RepID=A0A2S7WM55_9FLAO|nr:hypothetical protein [Polaribacter porphyrae]PQJ78663.1 hypothetical protein BTO18_05445 [Polaribacter porphyrae]
MNTKYKKLGLSILFDVIGFFTFAVADYVWAPISGYLMTKMYKGTKGKVGAVVSFFEEIIPFSDIVPTFTLMWIYTYLIKREDKKEKEDIITIDV